MIVVVRMAVRMAVRVVMGMVVVMRVIMAARGMVVIMAMTGLVTGIKDMDPPTVALIIMGMVNMAVPVSTRLGLKTLIHFTDRTAEPLDHGLQHMVGQQSQPARAHLHRYMPIADVIGNTGQLRGIAGPNFHQGLGSSLDRNHAAVFEQQTIAMAQQAPIGQVHADLFSAEQFGPKARALALLETQLENLVDRCMAVGALGGHLEGHDESSEGQTPYQNRK